MSYQRSHSLTCRRRPPCPCWRGHFSSRSSPPSWTEEAPPWSQSHPSCLDESTLQSSHRSAGSPAKGGQDTNSIISLSVSCWFLYVWKCKCVLPSPDLLYCPLSDWVKRWACWAPSLCKASLGSVRGFKTLQQIYIYTGLTTVWLFLWINKIVYGFTCNKLNPCQFHSSGKMDHNQNLINSPLNHSHSWKSH